MKFKLTAAMIPMALLAAPPDAPAPRLDSPAVLEQFFFPAAEEQIFESMKQTLGIDRAGALVTAAANVGPAYASRVAATVEFPEFRRQYADLAKYLDLFGSCQKRQMAGRDGWWSGYPDKADDAHCREAAKLIFANTLWSQLHYCRQLATGEVNPKFGAPPDKPPPYRLDEPPVATVWLKPEALYRVADAAVMFHFEEALRKRAAMPNVLDRERDACLDAAAELEKKPPNRELVALALAKVMVRTYEAVHLRHLEQIAEKKNNPAAPK